MADIHRRRAYRHIQSTPAATWTVLHNLGRYPAGIKVILNGEEVETDLECPDVNTVVATFSTPQAGNLEII